MYDLIIIGAGPAGITATIYAARQKLNFLVISENIGGQVTFSYTVENYTGYQQLTGEELAKKFEEHMKEFDVKYKEGKVKKIEQSKKGFKVGTAKGAYEAKALVIATGAKPRQLKIPGEAEFKNKGLTYCAVCDAPLFKDKTVAVIGGGNSALEAALQLIQIAKKIYIINLGSALGGEEMLRAKVTGSSKVEVINKASTAEIIGDKFVTGLKYIKDDKAHSLRVEGIFIEIGYIPNSGIVKNLVKLNKLGEIEIDKNNTTSVNGIFAAGDCTDVPQKQIIVAAGEGCKAALAAFTYIARKK